MESTYRGAKIGEEGIFFTIAAGFADRECIVLQDALTTLAEGGEPDYMQIYQEHEYDIHLAARRLFLAGETSTPLVVDASAVAPSESH
jgi:hypothetical protein